MTTLQHGRGPGPPSPSRQGRWRRLGRLALRGFSGLAFAAAVICWGAVWVDWPTGLPGVLMILAAALAGWALPVMSLAAAGFALGRSRFGAGMALVLAVLIGVTVPPHHRLGGPSPEALTGVAAAPLRVMSLNVLFGRADPAQVVDAVRREKIDALVLTELTQQQVDALDRAGLTKELPHTTLAPADWAAGTGIYSRLPIASTERVAGTEFATVSVVLRTTSGAQVRLIGAHPPPPMLMPGWSASFDVLRKSVAAQSELPTIVAGDLNASQYNAPVRRLLDAGLRDAGATRLWSWQQPTWPVATEPKDGLLPDAVTQLFPVIRIDHVLVSDQIAVDAVRAFAISGSDHRALVAELRTP